MNRHALSVLVLIASVSVSAVVWEYSTFETKIEAGSIDQRLDRIENKIDRLIESKK